MDGAALGCDVPSIDALGEALHDGLGEGMHDALGDMNEQTFDRVRHGGRRHSRSTGRCEA